MSQRYVSHELTHFVGRGRSLEEQYELLIQIISTGLLKAPGVVVYEAWDPQQGRTMHYGSSVSIDPRQALSSNLRLQPGAVCFADIPLEDLQLHAAKYSTFGLAFRKEFLIMQGANPVFYVARQSRTNKRPPVARSPRRSSAAESAAEAFHAARPGPAQLRISEGISRAELFDRLERALSEASWKRLDSDPTRPIGMMGAGRSNEYDPFDDLVEILERYVFTYLKFFDHDLSETHLDNYYMEREWRVVGAVTFSLGDIERVLLPRKFASQFHAAVDKYSGQVTFLD